MPTQRETDRKEVLEIVKQSENRRMDIESVRWYIAAAEKYGEKHGLQIPIKYWIEEGRNINHAIPQEIKRWAESLP